MDRGKGGLKRSTVVDGRGIPLGFITAPANRHDSLLLGETLDTLGPLGELPEGARVYLDRAYDSAATREKLAVLLLFGEISQKGKLAALRAGLRWIVERARIPGATPTRSLCGVPRGVDR